ncbi:MAG: GxxExxY protein [Planctomycetota bacterium]
MNPDSRKEEKSYPHSELTGQILSAAFEVQNTLGSGFLEKVYENALASELNRRGINCEQQKAIEVTYKGAGVGAYTADLLVDEKVLIELKVVTALNDVHRAQVLNYLKAGGIKVGLLVNFAYPKLQYERLVL